MEIFLINTAILFGGLIAAAVFSRVAFAISEKVTRAPLLNFFISLFTWMPWRRVPGSEVGGEWSPRWSRSSSRSTPFV